MTTQLMTPEEVEELTTLSNRVRKKLEREGRFPQRIALGHRTIRYKRHEVEAWLEDPESVGEYNRKMIV